MNAYLDTTILTNYLLKPGSSEERQARDGLRTYSKTYLPVYAIKEFKAGPLNTYAYVHDKLLQLRSLSQTIAAVGKLYRKPYMLSTSLSALSAAVALSNASTEPLILTESRDQELADHYRLALATLIWKAWRRRRKVSSETIQDLECYAEVHPQKDRGGFIDLEPKRCDKTRECCLAAALKAKPDLLKRLRDAIPESSARLEDRNRRAVLRELLRNPDKYFLNREDCAKLGDAIFAFFCPPGCVILTTNLRDHKPLANSVGKDACGPE